MMQIRLAVCLIVFAYASACTSPGEYLTNLPAIGTPVENSMTVGRVRIALPPGQWTVIGRRTLRNNIGKVNAEMILIQTRANEINKQEAYRLLFLSNNLQVGARGYENICTEQLLAEHLEKTVLSARDLRQNCWSINHMTMSFSDEQVARNADLRESRQYLRDQGILVPINMIYSKHRLANSVDYLTAWYFYNPDLDGIPQTRFAEWEKSDWHKNNIVNFPRKRQYIETIKQQSQRLHNRLAQSFSAG